MVQNEFGFEHEAAESRSMAKRMSEFLNHYKLKDKTIIRFYLDQSN